MVDIPFSEWEKFIPISDVIQLEKDEEFVRATHVSTDAYFIIEGLVSGYRKLSGHKYVHFLRSTNDFMQFSENEFFNFNEEEQQYEGEIFVALEDTIAIRISDENLK